MICFPNAKINLGLHIVSRRSDGFHNIESLMLPVAYCDILEIIPDSANTSCSFSLSGNIPPGDAGENLCVKAFGIMQRQYRTGGVKMHLHKNIAIGAGLVGGSSDATFTLIMLNKIFDLQLSDEVLEGHAAELGSDCAFFIKNKPAIASGKGNILTLHNINLKDTYVVLVLPDIHVSTAEAYQHCVPDSTCPSLNSLLSKPQKEWPQFIKNHFESGIFAKYPQLASIKTELYRMGAVYAAMSGSGSSVYGIFRYKPVATSGLDSYRHYTTRIL